MPVQVQGFGEGEALLTILDRLGRIVLVQKIEEGTQQLQFDLSRQQFDAGDYFVRVVSGSGILTKKLVLAK